VVFPQLCVAYLVKRQLVIEKVKVVQPLKSNHLFSNLSARQAENMIERYATRSASYATQSATLLGALRYSKSYAILLKAPRNTTHSATLLGAQRYSERNATRSATLLGALHYSERYATRSATLLGSTLLGVLRYSERYATRSATLLGALRYSERYATRSAMLLGGLLFQKS
jgi:hypothetical protein